MINRVKKKTPMCF